MKLRRKAADLAERKERAYKEIIAAAYANDPIGWDRDDMSARAERLGDFLRTSTGRHMLNRLSELGIQFRFE